MKTSRDFEDLLGYFNARGVEYLVVGAHAFAFHAKPRFTKDLELLVRSSPLIVAAVECEADLMETLRTAFASPRRRTPPGR